MSSRASMKVIARPSKIIKHANSDRDSVELRMLTLLIISEIHKLNDQALTELLR